MGLLKEAVRAWQGLQSSPLSADDDDEGGGGRGAPSVAGTPQQTPKASVLPSGLTARNASDATKALCKKLFELGEEKPITVRSTPSARVMKPPATHVVSVRPPVRLPRILSCFWTARP